MSTPFRKAYTALNLAQKEAVDTIEGPVMVIAGPGTGKTQILTLRIANILQKADVEPRNILALTFTESGVMSMRRRLADMIGPAAYRVSINTFHGFCNGVIKDYPEEFPHIIGARHISDVDQIRILENSIMELPLKDLKPFGDTFYYLRPILGALEELKRQGVSPSELLRIAEHERDRTLQSEEIYHTKGAHKGKMKGEYQKLFKSIAKHIELSSVYEVYQRALREGKWYDYSDMIVEVRDALLENQDLLLMLQEQYLYLLVDEHQDTNNAQNKILEVLCNFHPNPNVFVVGDDKQAIFRFQGASLENFLYFKTLYPEAVIITLQQNYRSSQCILDSAHCVLAGPVALEARAGHGNTPISLYAFSQPPMEYYFLAKEVDSLIERGVAYEDIAILYRDNRDALPLADMFAKQGIPFVIESNQNILEDFSIKKILKLLRAVHEFSSPAALFEAIHVDFLGIAPLDVYTLIASHRHESIYRTLASRELLEKLSLENTDRVSDFFDSLSRWYTLERNISFQEFFETLIRESGYLTHILRSPNAQESLVTLSVLFDDIKGQIENNHAWSLKDFFAYLETREAHALALKKSSGITKGKVRLMTAHRSKGLEFDHVYLINCYDGHWGNKRRNDTLPLLPEVFSLIEKKEMKQIDEDDDERRLFYVALTRAKKRVSLSYTTHNVKNQEQLPCQFITEIREELLHREGVDVLEREFLAHEEMIYAPKIVSEKGLKDKELVQELFSTYGMSVTALNNYLTCPWKYFYTNLLRLPQATTKHQMYGTAVHAALKDFFERRARGDSVDKESLIAGFSRHLERQPLSEEERGESLLKGTRALEGYADWYQDAWFKKVEVEVGIDGVMITPDIRLTGKIDKIEMLEGNTLNVVDYKTSKAKTRNDIEGNTLSSSGDIKRQLVFYNLLLNKDQGRWSRYNMASGTIDFIEPDEQGRYKREEFVITAAEVSELEETVRRVGKEILDLSFWEKGCGEKSCEFCLLHQSMVK